MSNFKNAAAESTAALVRMAAAAEIFKTTGQLPDWAQPQS